MASTDVVILTPIELEYTILRSLVSDAQPVKGPSGRYHEQGSLSNRISPLSAAIVLGSSKTTDIALVTKRIIDDLNPKVLILAGIAGGVKDVSIGDVVIASKAYGYESGKESERGFLSRPEVLPFDDELTDYARLIARRTPWQSPESASPFSVTIGPIASGDKLIATNKGQISDRLFMHYNDTVALEMEAIGFAKAAVAHRKLRAMNIRGVSDLLNNKSLTDGQGGQKIALSNLKVFLKEFLYNLDITEFDDTPMNKPDNAHSRDVTKPGHSNSRTKNTINNSNISVGGDFNMGDRSNEYTSSGKRNNRELKNRLRNLIGNNQIPEVFSSAKARAQQLEATDSQSYVQIYQLENRFSELNRRVRMGTISNSDENVERSRITAALLDLINIMF
ncbi:hypothetical protein CEQ90_05175 [Lewinellaceae bacterium SD302]|nr:hypothetical protein CEQ90_05175 [Lewinellaceae bacterium SD302]